MKYTDQMTSDGLMYIPSLMKTVSETQVILTFISRGSSFVL
jgi:hypothetical protein